ncbi:MAG: LamG-like jellyroll fold domain-containing protein [Pseudomonadota bacterium]
MTKHLRNTKLAAICSAIVLSFGLSACGVEGLDDGPLITESGYAIDILSLDGETDLGIEPAPQLEPAEQTTIEFWVQADWTNAPEFDPVIVSSPGEDGVSYLVAIDRDRDGIIVGGGDTVDTAPFDFTDGKMHHVALIDYGGSTTLLIDDQNIAELPLGFSPMESEGLFFGSFNGGEERFTGKIGGFRQWNVAVPANIVRQFRLKDVTNHDDPHPDLDHLAVISDFGNDRVVYVTK